MHQRGFHVCVISEDNRLSQIESSLKPGASETFSLISAIKKKTRVRFSVVRSRKKNEKKTADLELYFSCGKQFSSAAAAPIIWHPAVD